MEAIIPNQELQIDPVHEPKKSNKRYYILGILIIFIISIFSIYIYSAENKQAGSRSITFLSKKDKTSDPSPTPFPFMEMTIEYLKSRSYSSKIENVNNISQNSSYSINLASYNSDGLKLNGMLTIPNSDKPEEGYPAIIFIHGYIPPTQYQTLENYNSYVDYFARNGYVVFKIDLRGHAQSEGEAGGAYYSGDYVVDTLNAYSALQSYDLVDSKKIGLWGHSMAGNVVYRSITANPDIKAAVIWAGAVYTYEDWQEFEINDNSYVPPSTSSNRQRTRERLFATHGEFDPESEFWKQIVPTNYLEYLKTPIQLNHAVDDDVVSVGYSRNLNSILSDANKVVELREYTSGGHNLTGGTFNQAMSNSLEFYDRYLKN